MTTHTNPAGMAGPNNAAPGRRCKFGRTLDAIATRRKPLAGRLLERLHDDNTTDRRLAQAISSSGQHVAASLLSMHRTGQCVCSDPAGDDRKATA